MVGKTRAEILDAIRGAGARGSRLEFMRICSAHPIDFATANHAFLEGRDAAREDSPRLSDTAAQMQAATPGEAAGEGPIGRYVYDFGPCATAQGWAKFASAQDAVDFGNWASPTELKWINYRAGETTVVAFEDPREFVAYCRATFAWYEAHDRQRPSLEAGLNEDLREALLRLGLADLMGPSEGA